MGPRASSSVAGRRASRARPAAARSQHFLRSSTLAAELVAAAIVGRTTSSLDLGAGRARPPSLAPVARRVVASSSTRSCARLRAPLGNVEVVAARRVAVELPSRALLGRREPPLRTDDATSSICCSTILEPLVHADLIVEWARRAQARRALAEQRQGCAVERLVRVRSHDGYRVAPSCRSVGGCRGARLPAARGASSRCDTCDSLRRLTSRRSRRPTCTGIAVDAGRAQIEASRSYRCAVRTVGRRTPMPDALMRRRWSDRGLGNRCPSGPAVSSHGSERANQLAETRLGAGARRRRTRATRSAARPRASGRRPRAPRGGSTRASRA